MANDQFQTDLHLLAVVPPVPTDVVRDNDRSPGNDLQVRLSPQGTDLETLDGVPNLAQALILRFLTPKGALANLGHPDYGSDLYTLIGERNTETNRNRAKLYVLEALAQETRIAEVVSVSVTSDRLRAPTRIEVAVTLRPVGETAALTLAFPLTLA
jgi:phage baseplate assembly protein W